MKPLDTHTVLLIGLLLAIALAATSCGGGQGVAAGATGPSLVGFLQEGQDTIQLNQVLEFQFSEPIAPGTVGPGSIQIREGPTFGVVVQGEYEVIGNRVIFAGDLPSQCDYSDSGLKPGKTYRVTLTGFPEEASIRNLSQVALIETSVHTFTTRIEGDPNLFADQIPGVSPSVTESDPPCHSPAVGVATQDEITVRFSENLDPCSLLLGSTVRLAAHERGDPLVFLDAPNGNKSGFDPVEDQARDDPYTWGGNGTTLAPKVPIAGIMTLTQSRTETILTVRPVTGSFPENALVVLDLTPQIRDFGGYPLDPLSICFTMENLDRSNLALPIHYDDTTPIDAAGTTVDVNTPRSPGRAQAWLSFSGDGDNGQDPVMGPAWPILDGGGNYVACEYVPNSGNVDDVIIDGVIDFDTGSTVIPTSCTNESDGSTAVMWELNSLKVTSTGLLRITGVNPAILLVRNAVTVDTGGQILVAGSAGEDSHDWNAVNSNARKGGDGIAGGGGGGDTPSASASQNTPRSDDGQAGYGSPDYGMEGGHGAGEGGSSSAAANCNYTNGAMGGGGGGHGDQGGDAARPAPAGNTWADPNAGHGGDPYPSGINMQLPSAGSGGGGGGGDYGSGDEGSGGGGGGGGGFLGITAGGNISIFGQIDARGGRGGRGGWDPDGACNGANAGGGGGGSGGGIRLVTPGVINVQGATITAAGGQPGQSGGSRGGTTGQNSPGAGAGAVGRIAMEDRDGIIAGLGSANVLPGETQTGFFRGPFDSGRFVVGGTEGTALTLPLPLGTILEPSTVLFETVEATDLIAGIPAEASRGSGTAGIVFEVQGYDGFPDGTVDDTSGTGWYVVGFLSDSGVPGTPTWNPEVAPGGFDVDPAGGIGIAGINGKVFVQVRSWYLMADDVDASQPGPYVDWQQLRFSFDN